MPGVRDQRVIDIITAGNPDSRQVEAQLRMLSTADPDWRHDPTYDLEREKSDARRARDHA